MQPFLWFFIAKSLALFIQGILTDFQIIYQALYSCVSLADGRYYLCRGSFRFSYLKTNWSFRFWDYLKSDCFYSSATILLEVLNLQASVLENVHLHDIVLAGNCENVQDKRGQTAEISFCSGLWKVKGCTEKWQQDKGVPAAKRTALFVQRVCMKMEKYWGIVGILCSSKM